MHIAYGKKFQTDLPRCFSLLLCLALQLSYSSWRGKKVLLAQGNAQSPAEEPEAAQQLAPAPYAGRLAGNL